MEEQLLIVGVVQDGYLVAFVEAIEIFLRLTYRGIREERGIENIAVLS